MRKIISIFLVLMLFSGAIMAQAITVTAKLDSSVIKIGDQAHFSFEISQKNNQHVLIPVFGDTIIGGIEIVERAKVDTVTADGHLLIKHGFVITSFEDSLFYIPPFPFVSDKGDTVWSKSLSLKVVQPFKIDTATYQIAAIKPVFDPPFDWAKLGWVLLLIILIHGIIVAGIYFYKKYFKKELGIDIEPEKLLPPYVVALTHLDQIKKEKPWQAGRNKEYHTELTDVLRGYIERMYDLSAMEMTSDEILENLKGLRLEQKSAYLSLKQILGLADLVKFAKYTPAPDEHELSLMNAYLFVNQTKIEEIKPVEELKSEELNVTK